MRLEGFSGHLLHGFREVLPSVQDGILPQHSSRVIAQVLDECQTAKEAGLVLRLHRWLCESGVETQTLQGNYVVAMLVEAGSIYHAQQLFCRLTARIPLSWNSLIVGLINCGKSQLALNVHRNMKNIDFMDVNGHTAVALLQACGALGDMERGLKLHADFMKTELPKRDPFVGCALLEMYSKCASLNQTRNVFEELTIHDVVSWTTLMTGYLEHRCSKEALTCLERMQSAGVPPDAITFTCGLKACGIMGCSSKIQELHGEVEKRGFLFGNVVIGSVLIDNYAKCGLLVEAQHVFDNFEVCDTIAWNVLISGYLEKGQNQAALDVFHKMKLNDLSPDSVTYIHTLKACGNIGSIIMGQDIHMEIARMGLTETHALVGSSLLEMYIMCNSLTKAQEVFDNLPLRDSITWNIMIAGYFEHSWDMEALECFKKMVSEGFAPDTITYTYVLRSCGGLRVTELGEIVHAEIIKAGCFENSLFVGNNLIEMYMNLSFLTKARQVFDSLSLRDITSWNILITGYAKHGYYEEALQCYAQLHTHGTSPDIITIVCCLNISAILKAVDRGQELHSEIGRLGYANADVSVASAVVDMYVKCGFLAKAEEVFHSYPIQDAVMWNALITGYAQHSCSEEAFTKFEQMQLAGCMPSAVTVIAIFKACGKIGAVHRGEQLYTEVTAKGLFHGDRIVGNTLIDMYAKAGAIVTAQHLFDQLSVDTKDSTSWNALIGGYAQLGKCFEVCLIINKMLSEGEKPDNITFSILLSVCSNLGPVKECPSYLSVAREGQGIFWMIKPDGLYRFGHFMSQVGQLETATGPVGKIPFHMHFTKLNQDHDLFTHRNWGTS